jgi:hypothetical protein
MADVTPQSVTRQDLRDALASGPGRRPTSLLNAAPVETTPVETAPAWDWDGGELGAGEQLELHELRQLAAEQREHIEEVSTAKDAAEARERELRAGLQQLAGAGPFRRGRVIADLRGHGLL